MPAYVGSQPVPVISAMDLHSPLQSCREETGGELVGHGHAGWCIDHKHLQHEWSQQSGLG